MNFVFNQDGTLEMAVAGKTMISRSPIGMAVMGERLIAPEKADVKDGKITLSFEARPVQLDYSFRKNGSLKLVVSEIPDEIDGFVFGPYVCPEAVKYGEVLGAAWGADGSAVCIQSLNPKTSGELQLSFTNDTPFPGPSGNAAGISAGKTVLACSAANMTHPRKVKCVYNGFADVTVDPVPAPDGSIVGAAVVLTFAESADKLLADIGELEIEENLPHPTIDGEWAKTSPHATDIYFIFGDGNSEAQVRIAEKAGVKGIYYGDPFTSWGHFGINEKLYPGGEKEFAEVIADAKKHGVNVGFHTLTNFIHTHDEYVSPVPHKDLLAFDPTTLTKDISAEDSDIFIAETLNYANHQTLGAVRIGDEIVQFTSFDAERKCLTGCQRGAFGTVASTHAQGDTITHLADHGYGTLFPSISLQGEMADRIGTLIHDCKIRRISFDGVEGCLFTGHGEYAVAEFVRQVYEKCGSELICDASYAGHYRWHVHSYFNWGEPWYDYQHRGGMLNYRARNQDFFKRNLIPGMLGWFVIVDHNGKFEATLPETLEFILSRMPAYNAGLCINLGTTENDRTDVYCALIKLWQEFRLAAKIPDELRKAMQDKNSNWHLEKNGDQFVLTELDLDTYDLGYCDQPLTMESGTTGYMDTSEKRELKNGKVHKTNIVIDSGSPGEDIPAITEPLHCRIRVGSPLNNGILKNLTFGGGWYGPVFLSFDVTARAGDYLEYKGGTTLCHYDADYHLLEKIDGVGRESVISGTTINGLTVGYDTYGDDMDVILTHIRSKKKYTF